jgi:PAS domain S-box-containing protein
MAPRTRNSTTQVNVKQRGPAEIRWELSSVEESNVPMLVVDGTSQVIRYANPALLDLVVERGATNALVGEPLPRLFSDPELLEDLFERVFDSGCPEYLPAAALSGRGGRVLRAAVTACLVDSDGIDAGALLVQVLAEHESQDAAGSESTHQPRAAGDLQEANQQLILAGLREQELASEAQRRAAELKALLDNMMEGVSVFDASGTLVLMNPAGRRLLGFSSATPSLDDYRGCDFRNASNQPVSFETAVLSRLLRGESFNDHEIVIRREDGHQCHILMSGSAVRDAHSAMTLAITVFRDVTQLRELERQRQQYLALITHDLRGPLSSARLAADLIVGPPVPTDGIDDLLHLISRSLRRADRMLRDLLDVHRLKAGQSLILHLADCDLPSIARDVIEELSSVHGRRFLLEGVETLRGLWSADELRRAVWNLAMNAVKYGTRESPIVLRVERTAAGAAISVHNFGPPIPLEEQARLFAPFTQIRAGVPNGMPSWGLGLSLVRGCAEAHGGCVRVDSHAGAGTTFTIELPLDARPYQSAS